MGLIPTPEETRAANVSANSQVSQSSFTAPGANPNAAVQENAFSHPATPSYTAPSSISSPALSPQTAITVPPPPSPTTPQTNGATATMASNNAVLNPPTDSTTTDPNDPAALFQSFVNSQTAPPSTASIYENTYGIDPSTAQSQQAAAQADLNTKNQAVKDAQGTYDALQAQINGLDYQSNTVVPNQVSQNDIGKGATVGGAAPLIASQQRALLLQKAPLQLQALTAQANLASAQGNATLAAGILQQANAHIDALYNAQVQDAQNQYKYQSDMRTQIYDYATAAEKTILDNQQTAANQAHADQQAALANANDLAKTAVANGQADVAAKLMALDPTSSSYRQQLGALEGQMQAAPQKLQFVSATAEQPAGYFNPQTGKFSPISTGKGGGATQTVPVDNGDGTTSNVPVDVAPYYFTSYNGTGYVDASTLQGTAAQKTAIVTQAQAAGLKVITNKNTATDLFNITDANNKLDTVVSTLQNIDQPNALSRDLYGMGLSTFASMAQTDPQKAAAGVLSSIGTDILKAMQGVQGSRMSQIAVANINKELPTIYDTQATVAAKVKNLKNLLGDREDAILKGGGAGNASGSTPTQQNPSPTGTLVTAPDGTQVQITD